VLFAGRLIERKNVDLLLDAFDAIADEHDVTLGVIGDGPERDRLEAQRDSLAHAVAVTLLGFLDDYEDVWGICARLMCSCYRVRERGLG